MNFGKFQESLSKLASYLVLPAEPDQIRLLQSFEDTQKRLHRAVGPFLQNTEAFEAAFSRLTERMEQLQSSIEKSAMPVIQTLSRLSIEAEKKRREAAVKVIREAKPYMNEAQEAAAVKILPELKEESSADKTKRLSVSDWMSLLALIFQLIFFVLNYIPDAQLDAIQEREGRLEILNEEIIDQNSEEIELLRKLVSIGQDIEDELENIEDPMQEVDDQTEGIGLPADNAVIMVDDGTEPTEDLDDHVKSESEEDDSGTLSRAEDLEQ